MTTEVPMREAEETRNKVAQVLREHWLTGTGCDKERGINVATCFCSRWRSTEQPSPCAAAERWIEHVLEQL